MGATTAVASDVPTFHFPADPEYVVLTLDYYGGYGDAGTGSFRDEPQPTDPPPPYTPYLQLFGDGTVRVHVDTGRYAGDRVTQLEYQDLLAVLNGIGESGVLASPYRDCATAAESSRALQPNVHFLPSSDAGTMTLELHVQELVAGETREAPYSWRIVCRDLLSYASVHPDVPWLSSVRELEQALENLARSIYKRQ